MIRGPLENMGRLTGDGYRGTAVVPTRPAVGYSLLDPATNPVPISGLRD